MIYRITQKMEDFLPNIVEFITDPTIKGDIVGEEGKLSLFTFTDNDAFLGELVFSHTNWQGSISINGEVSVGEWDDQAKTLYITAQGGYCQVKGNELVVELTSAVV